MNFAGIDQHLWLKAYPAVAVNAVLFVFALLAKPRLRIYLLLFSATTLVDIFVAAKFIPIANAELQTALEYIFVLIGDLRFVILLAFLLYGQKKLGDLERFSLSAEVLKPAFVFTLFPTLLVTALGFARPELLKEPRYKFLSYEIIFFVLTFLWMFVVLPQKNIPEPEKKFLRRAAIPVFIFYGLWPIADLLILRGVDFGYALRIVPNLTYYCSFLWWVQISSSRSNRLDAA
jgi:hypothetical protein